VIAFQALQRTANFAISNPAREVCFTVLARDEKYKAKNVIDIVAVRGADAAGGWLFTGLRTLGMEVLFLTGLGSTETAPFAMGRTWNTADAANMGLPTPGTDLKLVPFEDRFEARLKGPHIFPGYWRQPELTAQAFDDEGYYRLGDTFVLADAADVQQGLIFRGRMAEDFKLATGTWVHVGPLRARLIEHFAPLVRDAVIAGEERDDIRALLLLHGPAPADRLDELLASFNASATGSSNRVARVAVLDEPPSLDAGEITDKGTLNQKAILRRRSALVEALYS